MLVVNYAETSSLQRIIIQITAKPQIKSPAPATLHVWFTQRLRIVRACLDQEAARGTEIAATKGQQLRFRFQHQTPEQAGNY